MALILNRKIENYQDVNPHKWISDLLYKIKDILITSNVAIIDEQLEEDACDPHEDIGWSDLVSACKTGDCALVKQLLERGVQVNMQQNDGWSALMSASRNGQYEVTKLLLERDAQVNLQQDDGWSALMSASQNGHYEVAKLLLDKGAEVDLQQDDGWSALMSASRNGHCKVAKLLLDRGAKVDLQQDDGWSALMSACRNGRFEVAKLLLESEAQVDLKENDGWSSLIIACLNKHWEVAKLLLRSGAQIDLLENCGRSALIIASTHGDFEVVEFLLAHGAQINLQDGKGFSSLHIAIELGNTKLTRLLIDRGAQAILRVGEHSALTLAIEKGAQVEVIMLLLQSIEVDRIDHLFEGLKCSTTYQNSDILHFLFKKCLLIMGEKYILYADSHFPGVHFFNAHDWNWITSRSTTIHSVGISVHIPEGALQEEESTDLLIRPCFSGPFELPVGYESASPAYLIQPGRRATIKKDITIRMHHYTDLQTEQDCEEMVFVFATSTPQDSLCGPVYKFKEVAGARCTFRPKDPVGQISLRHFCFLKIARWLGWLGLGLGLGLGLETGERPQSRGNTYCARLYRNLSGDVFSNLSAVFCVCPNHPIYTEHSNVMIREGYTAISTRPEALSVSTGPMVSDKITLVATVSKQWNVTFDKQPTKISREDLDVPEIPVSDYPPRFQIFVHPTSERETSNLPELQVKGLDEDYHFRLINPLRSSLASSSSRPRTEISATNPRRSTIGETEDSSKQTLTLRNILTALAGITKEWRNLGLALDLEVHIIEEIEADHSRDGVKRCLEKVINSWLKGNGSRSSWTVLCDALRSELVCRPAMANNINYKYVQCVD